MRTRPMLGLLSAFVVYLGVSALVPSNRLQGAGPSDDQQAAGAPAGGAAAHVYRVSAFRAMPGRLNDLIKLMTARSEPGPNSGDFAVVFRHRQGHEWDLLVVEHMGERATVSVPAPAPGQAQGQTDTPMSQLTAWHGDTFAAGPSLEEFRKALALTDAGQGTPRGVYVISDYMAAAGHRAQLRQQLQKLSADTPGRAVTLTHIEGAPWTFLHITRYDSWRQLADEEEATDSEVAKGAAGAAPGLAIREHMSIHHDTLAVVAGVTTAGR